MSEPVTNQTRAAAARRGPPGGSDGDVVIAIDVGGTGIKCALVDPDRFIVRHSERHPTHAARGPEAVVGHVLDVAAGLAERARRDGARPVAAGIAVPGIVDDRRGVARYSSNIGWRDVPLAALAEQRLGIGARLGHDVRTGGLAEARLGAGRGVDQVLFVPIGTGIAAAHVVAGHPFAGAHGGACELGHVVVRPNGRPCGCGRRGCLEAEASARAVAARYADAAGEAVTAAEVARRALAGESAAGAVWRTTVGTLADGLLTAITLFDPERIVLGGGLAEARDHLLTPLAEAIAARRRFETLPSLVRAELGDQAGCLGAALLATDVITEGAAT